MKKVITLAVAIAALFCLVLPSEKKAEAQIPYGNYCCDNYAVRRCFLVNGPFPVGSACWCDGQGGGWVCL